MYAPPVMYDLSKPEPEQTGLAMRLYKSSIKRRQKFSIIMNALKYFNVVTRHFREYSTHAAPSAFSIESASLVASQAIYVTRTSRVLSESTLEIEFAFLVHTKLAVFTVRRMRSSHSNPAYETLKHVDGHGCCSPWLAFSHHS